ncbi:TolB family protein [Actinokineospora sp.]|uniref:TolB family protein n=1 Tax=Actinokineospora sp. TaxID=1872133 RepID=UPI0040375F0A
MSEPAGWSPRQSPESPRTFRLRAVADDRFGSGDGAVSPDGRYFVASSRRGGSCNLWFYDLVREQWHQGTRGPGDDIEAQWSPDASCLAFTSTRGGRKAIWLYRLRDGRISRLTDGDAEDEYPHWSPDGRTIVYTGGAWGKRHFYVVAAAGGTPRAVTRVPGRAGACSFVPDGSGIIGHSYDTGAGAISVRSLDGSTSVQVSDGSAWDYKPTVCGAHPVAAFSRSFEGRSVIWLQRLDTGVGRALVTRSADDRWPNWTADGQSLFFHRLVDQGVAICVLDRESGAVREVVPAAEQPRYASFDPAAERIVYAAEEAGRSTLRIRELATGATTVLPVREAAFPQWSPDGRTIAFARRDAAHPRWEIATHALDTGETTVWTRELPWLKGMHAPLDWSPDGTRLVFKSDTEPFEADLCVLDLRTGAVDKLTDDPWWDEAPSWSPDGASVVFMSTRGGDWTWGFYRKHLDTGEIETVAGPDYVERNNPRLLSDGTLVSTLVASTVEELHEQLPNGRSRGYAAVRPGVRYPVPSADGRLLVFTRTHRTVEYWLAQDIWAADSPVADLVRDTAGEPARAMPSPRPAMGPVRSPVDTRRR